MGQSEQAKGASNLQNLLNNFYGDIAGEKGFQSKNLFEDYKSPFDYGKTSAELDKLNTQEVANVNKNAISDINKVSQGTTSAMASQGITGGSVLNDAVNKGRTGVLQNKYQTLSDISKNRTGQNIGLMQQENQNQFQNTSANQNQLNQQVLNMFQKYGLLQGNLGQQQANVGNLESSTFWDDIFAGLNTAGPLAALIPTGGASGAASGAAMALSDIRFKENISKIGVSPNGTNIYEFSYKGNPKRYTGAIAQENPDAAININGILFLDYSKLDVEFKEM